MDCKACRSKHTLKEAGIDAFTDEALQFRQRSRMDWLEPGFDGWDMMHHFMSKTAGAPAPDDLDDWIFKANGPKPKASAKPWNVIAQVMDGMQGRCIGHSTTFGPRCLGQPSITPGVGSSPTTLRGVQMPHAPRFGCDNGRTPFASSCSTTCPQGTSGTLQVATKDFEGRIVNQALVSVDISARRSNWSTLARWTCGARTTLRHLFELAMAGFHGGVVVLLFCTLVCPGRGPTP